MKTTRAKTRTRRLPTLKSVLLYLDGNHGEGGRGYLSYAGLDVPFRLSARLFSTLAIMVEEVKKPANRERSQRGFVSMPEFMRRLRTRVRLKPDEYPPDEVKVARYKYRVKNLLARAMQKLVALCRGPKARPVDAKEKVERWAEEIILSLNGYKLNIPADNLELFYTDGRPLGLNQPPPLL